MSDPRHAFIDRWQRRNYRFDGQDVLSVTTINRNAYSWNLENWKVNRAIDVTLGLATRSMREVHRMSEPDEKGQRFASGAVVQIKSVLDKPSQAATTGIGVHEALEAWFATGSLPAGIADEEVPFVEQAVRWAEEWNPKPTQLEPECYSESGYAGSIDGLFWIDGELCLIDYKTGGVFESAAMQLAAYAHADRLYPRQNAESCAVLSGGDCECPWIAMPAVDRMGVLDLKAHSYVLKWLTPLAAGKAWRAFQGAQAIHDLKKHRELFVTARQRTEEAA